MSVHLKLFMIYICWKGTTTTGKLLINQTTIVPQQPRNKLFLFLSVLPKCTRGHIISNHWVVRYKHLLRVSMMARNKGSRVGGINCVKSPFASTRRPMMIRTNRTCVASGTEIRVHFKRQQSTCECNQATSLNPLGSRRQVHIFTWNMLM